MNFHYATLDTCSSSTGLVVVIDVIRAFTSAAFALSRGAEWIVPVGTIEEAIEYKRLNPGSLACGEVNGLPFPGFDFGNSPTQIMSLDLTGRTIAQRTSAGTQGVVRSTAADTLFAASFVVAAATVDCIRALSPESITFVITGQVFDGGAEDLACAAYLEACLSGLAPDPSPYLDQVRQSHDARIFYDPSRPDFPESDIIYCTNLDRFEFAMPIRRDNGLPFIQKSFPDRPLAHKRM
jgi:2-phosphosulfolactate phosphatase